MLLGISWINMGEDSGMKPRLILARACAYAVTACVVWLNVNAAEIDPAPPSIRMDRTTNGQPRLVFPVPAAQQYNVLSASEVTNTFAPDVNSGQLLGPSFIITNSGPARFYRVNATLMSSNDVFIATVLNRLTYGPTPDDIDRIRSIGPQAYIDEQLAGETIIESIDTDARLTNSPPPPPPLTNWIRKSVFGTTTGTNMGITLSAAGRVYLDNFVLVRGTNADVGENLLLNGDFEDPNLTNFWRRGSTISSSSTVITNSPTTDGQAASGTNCLLLTATSGTTAITSGLWQPFATNNPSSTQRFCLSFSYLPVQNQGTNILLVRLSGSSTTTNVALPTAPATPPVPPPAINMTYDRLINTNANLDDFRAWHVFRAIHSKRQLQEVLAQFFQNHFTTQYGKTEEYFDNNYQVAAYTNNTLRRAITLDLHWREHNRLREALLNPNCTFYDLLKVSIESEAMIIYLDTQLNSKAAPNQNYAREVMELHTMGADNGYIQQDIVDLSKVWTGWRVAKKIEANASSPFTPSISGSASNIVVTPGSWVLHFTTNNHDTGTKRLFTNSLVAARFGSAFGAGTSYALVLSNTLATGTNGMAEGYKVAQHLATLPYTMEFVSVKLCQLFVHENFEYGVYDYTAPNLTLEAQLVKDCMTAWNTAAGDGRKGNIRSVLNVIFNSALFRGQGSSHQKVKTPLEYSVSAVRALRVATTDTNSYTFSTCDSDGYGIAGTNNNTYPLSRMGGMGLFNKPEPDGWSELGRIWLNTANLCERMRFVEHLLMATGSGSKTTDYGNAGRNNTSDPVALLKLRLPAGSWNNDAAVVDFFLGLLYPGEGAGNLGRDREAAITYLNTDDAGAASAFTSLNPSTYDTRVRTMVGFLMSLPRFQEQ
jgi:uncharacterized protein (DUF1800 family)